jgi:hypothetical protein
MKAMRRVRRDIPAVLVLLMAAYAGNANSQVPPTKNIKIYNNSTNETIYPVLAAYVGAVDLWMQAQFNGEVTDVNNQTFCNNDPSNTLCSAQDGKPRLYRAYVIETKESFPGNSYRSRCHFIRNCWPQLRQR